MSEFSRLNALKKSAFNTANLSGLAAVFLSYSIGSAAGTLVFLLAVLVGSYNKYQSVRGKYGAADTNPLLNLIRNPALTAQILMLAAFINFIKAGYNGFMAPDEQISYFICLSLAWLFGFLGDDALRRNDTTNFSDPLLRNNQALWIKTFIYVTRNPVFYYLLTNLFFSSAIFLTPGSNQESSSFLFFINTLAVITALSGVFYGIIRGVKMMKGIIDPSQTNNGVINFITVIMNLEIGIISMIQGLYWVVFAQILFAIANITCLYETRHALDKEKHF